MRLTFPRTTPLGRQPWRHLLVALMLLAAPAAQAGGTLAVDELMPLLRAKPGLGGFLLQAFRLPSSAFAVVRLGSHFTHLGGRRLGPYVFEATPQDPAAPGPLLISLCTRHQFLDRSGAPLPDSDDPPVEAAMVREELVAIVVREPSAIASGSGCP